MADSTEQRARIRFVHHLLRARDYQDRPQFGQLCEWWRDIAAGVCALVGIGGAGKTAIVERFLRVLPGAMPPQPDLPKDDTLPTPEHLFVFSFYDAPNPDAFFAEIGAWLAGESDEPRSYEQTLRLLEEAPSCLLVLDGLEKVQDDGLRGGTFGRIMDGRLRDFVVRVSAGHFPLVAVAITTRFRPFEPLAQRCPYYWAVPVAQLSEETAIDLLRARGVKRGTNDVLRGMARDLGLHALTVDLMGGYVGRFCNGDPARLPADWAGLAERTPDRTLDPEIAAIREQEHKFARVAERYHEALAQSDPAGLALLQRVCLFRLGVIADTLASIFTGRGKKTISGPALARLSPQALQQKLDLLVEMRLIEATASPQSTTYCIHPAVRDGFLSSLDADAAQQAHNAAREGLTDSLGGLPSDGSNPSDPATLDLLEEIVYHTLEAGHAQEAWDIYRDRIGGYRNLLLRLGAYERGERICRAFAAGQPPESAPLPEGLSENDQAVFIASWAVYLTDLGRLDAAVRCFERNVEMRMAQKNWKNASTGNQTLADILLLAGRLGPGLRASEEALTLAERADDAEERKDSYAGRAHAHAQRGDVQGALDDFHSALRWQHEDESKADRALYSLSGVQQAALLSRVGRVDEAKQLTDANIEIWAREHGRSGCLCNLLLADVARERGDLAAARDLCQQAHDWALARDAKEPLCWSALVRAKIALTEAGSGQRDEAGRVLGEALAAIEEGLRIARDCGFGVFHIDLLVLRAQVRLMQSDADGAEQDARTALFGQSDPAEGTGLYNAPALDESSEPERRAIFPPDDSGLPTLLAATHPECGYAWGEGDARHLLAEALLLRAAQALGATEYKPRSSKTPPEVRDLVKQARAQLTTCQKLRKRIQDPKIADTKRVLAQLKKGVLTSYPLTQPVSEAVDVPSDGKNFDLFLSHNSKDKPTAREIATALKERGIKVWLDEWELAPGDDWQEALEDIIETAGAAAVLMGSDDLGPWQGPEVRGLLSEFVRRDMRVIPLFLPGAPEEPEVPLFLKQFTWLDLREGLTEEGLDELVRGITGKKPGARGS